MTEEEILNCLAEFQNSCGFGNSPMVVQINLEIRLSFISWLKQPVDNEEELYRLWSKFLLYHYKPRRIVSGEFMRFNPQYYVVDNVVNGYISFN